MRYEAAYARQSVEKKNSLSIKGQLDLCTQTSGNSSLLMYSDQGYSGKNTDRPDFQRLLKDIKADKVSKLYVSTASRVPLLTSVSFGTCCKRTMSSLSP